MPLITISVAISRRSSGRKRKRHRESDRKRIFFLRILRQHTVRFRSRFRQHRFYRQRQLIDAYSISIHLSSIRHGYLCKCFFHFLLWREIQESSRRGCQNKQYRCRSRYTEEQNPTTMLASHRNFLRELFPKAIPYTHPGISETRAKQIGYFIIFFLHDFYTL